jgi:hypothetical protein
MMKPSYMEAVERSGVLGTLSAFGPRVAGTPPLGLDLPGSDIDILCHAPDLHTFAAVLWTAFSDYPDFSMRQWVDAERPVIASFEAEGWQFEIFGQARPVAEQQGWRHFLVEQRLLGIGGPWLRTAVMAKRREGAKTEPAFAAALNLQGDPYQALLELEHWSDRVLAELITTASN